MVLDFAKRVSMFRSDRQWVSRHSPRVHESVTQNPTPTGQNQIVKVAKTSSFWIALAVVTRSRVPIATRCHSLRFAERLLVLDRRHHDGDDDALSLVGSTTADRPRKPVLFSKKRPSAFIRGQFGLKGATGQAESADLDAVVPSREVFARETNRPSQFKRVGLLPV